MTISEVSKQFDISADTLRYYERIGLVPNVTRNKNGIRNYTEDDCRWVEFAKCMRSAGIQVEALIEYVALFQQGEATQEARKQILIEQRELLTAKIGELQKTLERLNTKIDRYDQTLALAEQKLKKTKEYEKNEESGED